MEFPSATYAKHHDGFQIKGEEMNRGVVLCCELKGKILGWRNLQRRALGTCKSTRKNDIEIGVKSRGERVMA